MFFKRLYDNSLAQASYIVGCQRTGEALVVDPNRDIEQYIVAAEKEGLRVTHVTETHIHADFVSGSRELASRTGARLFLSDEGGAEWKYTFAKEANATFLYDNDSFMVGNIRIDVLHTPGHTPEHLSFLITDTPAAAGPWGILTGDFVFVGDVGRPDLLERAAGYSGTMEAGARVLFQSLQRFRSLPDHLQLWPGHGAGSACGKALGAIPSSTVGYEKIGNWGVATTNEEEFVRMVLDGQPEPPRYFAQMKRINKEGAPFVSSLAVPPTLSAADIAAVIESGKVVVDTRSTAAYAVEHIPGTINIPLNGSFTTWAGWLLPYTDDFYLIVDASCDDCARRSRAQLLTIGLDRLAGVFASDVIADWKRSGKDVGSVRQTTVQDVAADIERGGANVVDVRGFTEWHAGHLPNSRNIPVGYLTDHLDELPRDTTVVLQCQGGTRSSIAASVLQSHGFTNIVNLVGGYSGWAQAGLPVDSEAEVVATSAS